MAAPMGLNTRATGGVDTLQDAERGRFLAFNLGREAFAMDILTIKEVIQYAEITEVPLAPPSIRGVINLRGAVVPVIDLAVRFGWNRTEIARRTCVVIVEMEQAGERAVLGVIVDQVREVLEIAQDLIEPATTFGSKLRPDFIRGIGKVKGQFILILEINRVLALDELAALAPARPTVPA